ncbi:MAG: hypothetical protein MJ246_03790 [Clostridia bacterium]|nr:hypothetical protein [Clostridia bacterium]
MKDFFSNTVFAIFSIIVVLFLGVIVYLTLSRDGKIEKSKYEDVVVEKSKETINNAKEEADELLSKVGIGEDDLKVEEDGTISEIKVLCEKAYININEEFEFLSSYQGFFIANDGYIYEFYIDANNGVLELPFAERTRLMIATAKKTNNSVTEEDLTAIKRLIRRIKIDYEETGTSEGSKGTRVIALFNNTNDTRISLNEIGKSSSKNRGEDSETLVYLINKYIKAYSVDYSEYENR